jgi:hypothetical protein
MGAMEMELNQIRFCFCFFVGGKKLVKRQMIVQHVHFEIGALKMMSLHHLPGTITTSPML